MATDKTDNDPNKESDRLKKSLDRFTASWNYAQNTYHTQWEEAWKLYNNKRVHYNYKGTSETFVPMAFGAIEAMVAALGNGRPAFNYEPEYPEQQDETDVLNTLVDNYHDRDQWDVKYIEIIRQMLITGTAPAYVAWENDHPVMLHYSIRDAIIDPNLTSPWQLLNGQGYAGRRYLTTVDDLKEYEVVDTDPKSKTYGEMMPRFKHLDTIGTAGQTGADSTTDKERKDMFMGTTADQPDATQVEVIEIWDAERVVSIANRATIIEDVVNPHKQAAIDRGDKNPKGIIPFVFFRDYTDVSLFYGKGEIEPMKQHQELLNDLTNQNLDAITLQLSPQVELDPSQASWINKIDNTPGRVYPFKAGTINWREVPVIPANAFNERANIKAEIREVTAIDQIAKGVSDSTQQTATEVKAQLNQAGQRIDLKAVMLEKDGFYQLGVILFKLIQLYVDKPTLVKVATATGTDMKVFNPEEFSGNYHPRIQLDITAKQTKAEQQQKAMQAFQMVIQDPTNNLQAAKKILYPRMLDLEAKEIDEIISNDNPEDQGAGGDQMAGQPPVDGAQMAQGGQAQIPQGGAPGAAVPGGQGGDQAAQAAPEKPLHESLGIKFETLPEDVKLQLIEQIFGITPQTPTPKQQELTLKQQAADDASTNQDNQAIMQLAQHHHTVNSSQQQQQLAEQQAAQAAEAQQEPASGG